MQVFSYLRHPLSGQQKGARPAPLANARPDQLWTALTSMRFGFACSALGTSIVSSPLFIDASIFDASHWGGAA